MKIVKVDVMQLGTDVRPDWRPIVCRIYTDEGIYGDGEAAMAYDVGALGAFGMLQELAKMVIGMDPLDNEVIWDKLYRSTFWGQNGGPVTFSAISAIDIALWDIKGKYFKVPVYKLLCEKKREAIDCQIDYTAYVEPGVPLSFIQDIDLIIIMGNIIDNAIEASKKVESGYLDIKIFETQKGHFLMIRVENKFNGIVKRQGDSFHTTKENESKHGIGLKNVKDCIKKYDGILQIDTENNVFTVSIIFTVL